MTERKSVRKPVRASLLVTDTMTGNTLGKVGNLSVDGLMLISPKPVGERRVYQVQFAIPNNHGQEERMEVGIQCLWSAPTHGDQSHWAGCQIIDISSDDQRRLDDWVERQG
jgi:hypothetical protein